MHEDYTKKFDASDNLKYALSGDTVSEDAKPLGTASTAAAPAAAGGPALASAQQH